MLHDRLGMVLRGLFVYSTYHVFEIGKKHQTLALQDPNTNKTIILDWAVSNECFYDRHAAVELQNMVTFQHSYESGTGINTVIHWFLIITKPRVTHSFHVKKRQSSWFSLVSTLHFNNLSIDLFKYL